ncbi:hypothetical protein ACFX2I_001139 [Malus domestica]
MKAIPTSNLGMRRMFALGHHPSYLPPPLPLIPPSQPLKSTKPDSDSDSEVSVNTRSWNSTSTVLTSWQLR